MARSTPPGGLADRLAAFVLERHPFALCAVLEALGEAVRALAARPESAAIESLRRDAREPLRSALTLLPPETVRETTPGVEPRTRIDQAVLEVTEAVDGFLRREAIAASFTDEERREMLRGMLLTRATDNQLKAFFLGGQVRYEGTSFQGKGLSLARSRGDLRGSATAAPRSGAPRCAGRLDRRHHRPADPRYRRGAVHALGARDRSHDSQWADGQAGPPMDGRDLHVGDLDRGILPAAAPLTISTVTAAGIALAFAQQGQGRVAASFIGEGASSLGEWHEAINVCAARRLPAIFCVQNNQTALSTPVHEQSSVRCFADKAAGYGIPGITIDGTDPEAIAAAFAWAAERARAGLGPTLIELLAMRICGHAHHDDMLYLGREPQPSWDYPELTANGYASRAAFDFWSERDPLVLYSERLKAAGLIDADALDRFKDEAVALVAARRKP